MTLNTSVAFAAPPKKKPPAAAQTPKEYDQAVALFRAGNPEAALAIFKKLTNIESRRGAAFALEKLGRVDEAIAEFEAFIAGAPPALDDQIKAARRRVVELSASRKGKLHVVTVPAGATVEVVGQPAPYGKTPIDIELPPGKHVVRATLPGNDVAEREVLVAPGPVQEVHLDLVLSSSGPSLGLIPAPPRGAPPDTPTTPPPTGAEAAAAPPPSGDRLGGPIITGALGALSLGTGIYFGLSALSKKSDYDANPTPDTLADAETAAALSTAGIVAGLVFGAATVVLLLIEPPADQSTIKVGRSSLRSDGLRVRF